MYHFVSGFIKGTVVGLTMGALHGLSYWIICPEIVLGSAVITAFLSGFKQTQDGSIITNKALSKSLSNTVKQIIMTKL